MAPPTIAFYASPPSSVCSTTHQINSHVSYDFELNSRASSSASSTPSSSTSPSQKPFVGGLSCLFSSPTSKHSVSSSYSGCGEELSSIRHERGEELRELSSSFRFSPNTKFVGSLKRDHQSPVSVFQGPFSSNSSGSRNGNSSVKSPPMRIMRDRTADVNVLGGGLSGSNGMFNWFVRNALSSFVEYDTSLVETKRGSVSKGLIDGVELAFNLEDCLVVGDLEAYAKELLSDAQSRNKVFHAEFVVKAFYEAERAHKGQSRANGDPYLKHCVETAVLLADIGASSTVVAAGLLHDTLDDTFMSYDYILRTFGGGVADLVEGVSKLSQLSKLARDNNTACKMDEADRLHTMFLAMADARAVLIKLADRLHNMMTLDALTFTKQQRFAKETLEIFAPLANRLGMSTWKEQLENLCFKHLNPEIHDRLSSQLLESFDEEVITSAVEKLERALNDDGISYHSLSGRHKSLYSIHCKMTKKKLTMDQIHDIQGLRLIVDNMEDCYKALRIVHQLWCEVPGKSKNYINNPKHNGYRSLHTVVMGDGMVSLEIQIRTKEMHLQAECGFAAHWRYKEGDCQHSSFVLQMVEWARWVLSWHCEAMRKDQSSIGYADCIKPECKFPTHADDCPSYDSSCDQDGPIFIIMIENEKMTVQELPAKSTMMDLVERVGLGSSRWSNYGFPSKEELRPRLNRAPVCEPTCKLKMGDVVELSPALPDKSLTEYREEIQRMYDRGPLSVTRGTTAPSVFGWRS